MTVERPPLWVKAGHAPGCDGNLYRLPSIVCVDRLGRIGNGGIVAHDYRCNCSWRGCGARVLVAEQTMRRIAAAAIGEPVDS